MVDIHGQVIGLSVPRGVGTGAGFALPSNLVKTIYVVLRQKESRLSPWLGFSVLHLSPELRRRIGNTPRTGVYIDNMFDPSPASRGGVQVGDVLVELGGQRILAVEDFQRWLYLFGIGSEVEVVLSRLGEEIRQKLVIEQRPQDAITR